jgi:hypothetical protein
MMKFYKILNESECHHGMQYKTGLNKDILPFDPSGDCEPGGIYFAREDILSFLGYGQWVREASIPDGEPVYENPGAPRKWKAHRVILGERRRIDAAVIAELLSEGAYPTSDAVEWAARNGHTECLRALLDAGAKPTSYAVDVAACNGHVDCLRILLDAGAKPTLYTVEWAVRNDHAECLRALLDAGAKPTPYAVEWVARNGHAECAELLRKALRADK